MYWFGFCTVMMFFYPLLVPSIHCHEVEEWYVGIALSVYIYRLFLFDNLKY